MSTEDKKNNKEDVYLISVPIVARVKRLVSNSRHVQHVNWLNIVVEIVRLHTDHNIRRSVRGELRNYMMRNYLINRLH